MGCVVCVWSGYEAKLSHTHIGEGELFSLNDSTDVVVYQSEQFVKKHF